MVNASLGGAILQLTIAAYDTYRADVIALGQQQLERHATITLDAVRRGPHVQSFFGERNTGGSGSRAPRDLHETQATGAHVAQTLELAQRWHVPPLITDHLKQRVTLACADELAVEGKSDRRRRPCCRVWSVRHARASARATPDGLRVIRQTPAGQTRSSMCARYSSRK